MWRAASLASRLVVIWLLWTLLALGAAALVLSKLYSAHVQHEHADRIGAWLDELSAALDVTADGALVLQRELSDPLFRRPYSGLYWEVQVDDLPVLRSRSLWDRSLGAPAATGGTEPLALSGPEGQALLIWTRTIQYPGLASPILLQVAADRTRIDQMTASFVRTLVISLLLLAIGLGAILVAQVRFGLAPLRQLGQALVQLRAGRVERVAGDYPAEISPLVEDLNAVLQENRRLLGRARDQAGNLAHALKTPLAVIRNELPSLQDRPQAEVIGTEVQRMHRAIERHLVRARAGATALPGRNVAVRDALEEIRRAVTHLHGGRVNVEVEMGGQPRFSGDAADLQEILGNLLDNAAKWARTKVRVQVSEQDGALRIQVEDDGPGIPPDRRAAALQRGVRLDTSQPGSGLGLQIVDELCLVYGGELQLGVSPLGGLAATARLPALRPG